MQGNVVVKSRSTLQATGVTVTGGLQGESPSTVIVRGSQFGNGISIRKGGAGNGQIEISGTRVTGDVQLEENRNPIRLEGQRHRRQHPGEQEHRRSLEITGNRIGNGLQCQDNRPAPVGGGNIAKQKQGQCRFL